MNRAFVIAALFGLAVSTSVASYSKGDNLVDSSSFTLDYAYEADAGWETFYGASDM